MAKQTTMRIDRETRDGLFALKTGPSDTYDEVLRRLIRDADQDTPLDNATASAD
jgi:hypothetical protein